MLKTHKANARETAFTACTFHFFWLGHRDWLMECIYGPAPGAAAAKSGSPTAASLWWLVLTIPAFILLAAAMVPFLAPTLVAGMTAAGSSAVADVSMGLGVLSGLAVAVGVPFLLARRFLRFAGHCCERGQSIERGERRRAGP
ncbi:MULTISPECIES: hypothetical protein [unclassified Variovorax]|uniref:hypothetical protein n=1 Tax=unclassified Variovorax TaxID=663243 RepID=UPI00076CE9C4|nr:MULTISPECIES: hypothetical protein [unclassified Variovorax]KWT98410.1 hypothetical protein APY03_0545 [Variovorax sp. WDL1]PNG49921.1 hypothetical protein CHC06_05502 [Variovorax sp. B2]PNG50793.1 hypothetical protein CHC07_05407 [Variovorax sp. B4]VTV18013.1 hypothetical protein WDL1P1_00845 [Variovorax sp. WDL1]